MNIIIIGTLDTRGAEVGLLRDEIVGRGHTAVVLDSGIQGRPAIPADVTREELARAGGALLAELIASGDEHHCQRIMSDGLVTVISRLHAEGQVDGVVAVGGARGSAMAITAMRTLPVGVPKVMVSSVACGPNLFGADATMDSPRITGTKDVTLIPLVADSVGLNRFTRHTLAQAAAAAIAMASVGAEVGIDAGAPRELVAITQTEITMPGAKAVQERLEKMGFEVIVFRCSALALGLGGSGGQGMEELVRDGLIQGVIDFSPADITGLLFDGWTPPLPGRLEGAGQVGIPQIVVPGGVDIRLRGKAEELPEELARRAYVQHKRGHTHVRTSPEEMAAIARFVAERLNSAVGPRAVLIPLQGFSMLNREGEVLYDEAANLAFVETMRQELWSDVGLIEVRAHINDRAFADLVVGTFLRLREVALEGRR